MDLAKLKGAAARLKACGYRSAGQYLYSRKREHVLRGHAHPVVSLAEAHALQPLNLHPVACTVP